MGGSGIRQPGVPVCLVVAISPEGSLLLVMGVWLAGCFRSLHLQDEHHQGAIAFAGCTGIGVASPAHQAA